MKYLVTIQTILFILIITSCCTIAQVSNICFCQISPPEKFKIRAINSVKKKDLGYYWMVSNRNLIGHYSYKIKQFAPSKNSFIKITSSNSDGNLYNSQTQLQINLKKDLYFTPYAYITYFIILLGLFYIIGRFYFERIKLKKAILFEKNQRKNEEQLNQMKLKFFTNISHEFRTPLALISWPLQRLLNAKNITSEQREELEVAERNTNRLLQLIDHITDLRKLENENSKLHITRFDLIYFIKEIKQNFISEMKSRKIDLIIESPYSFLEIEADQDKLDAIVFNLLSNAYKHVPAKGKIKIVIDRNLKNETSAYSNKLSFGEIFADDYITIAIEDTGPGIDKEDLQNIFNRFEQGKRVYKRNLSKIKGSGIGLAICKDYTMLHHGKILVQTDKDKGSCFTVNLPSKQKIQNIIPQTYKGSKNLKYKDKITILPKISSEPGKKNKILVVEDNADLCKLITRYLGQYYQITTASNGKKALAILKQHDFDLILSDVMMPEMDGFEFCQIIKAQIETSHIPVIILTALSSSENLIAGLDKGADAYLTKPFDENVLLKQIENLLEQRKRIKENISKQLISKNTVETGSLDNYFLNRVRMAVENNISDENFGMDKLALELSISRSKLHRKIKSLTGITTSDFVNLIRVKKAVELITNENHLFSEVAYKVGFNSQSYFNRCFKKIYNITPKQFFEKQRTESEQINLPVNPIL